MSVHCPHCKKPIEIDFYAYAAEKPPILRADKYLDAYKAATAGAKTGSLSGAWNRSFRESLAQHGLRLGDYPLTRDVTRYPGLGYPMRAPMQLGIVDGWPSETYMVWREL